MRQTLSTIAITTGEPAGIGPELCLQVLPYLPPDIHPVVIADPALLSERAALLDLDIQLREYRPGQAPTANSLDVVPVALAQAASCGKLNPANAAYVLQTLDAAIDGCRQGLFQAMVTAPVQKSIINDAGIPFSGHTEYLAAAANIDQVVMMLATEGLRVALATTHLPLARVPEAITRNLLLRVIRILHHDLQQHFGIGQPRILVCGLNPHAGENGHLGHEEQDIIEPLIRELAAGGMQITGPLPADTLFTEKHLSSADAVLAMYHDQGLPVLKYKGFGKAVNITLGLPFIRTSVDHGTALDLAGTGKADHGSLLAAIHYANNMASSRSLRQPDLQS